MTRKLSDWNIFVKKIYAEGKAKNPKYEFKQALEDASKRKSEMKHSAVSSVKKSKTAKRNIKQRSRSASASASLAGGKSRRRHSRRRRH